MNWRCVETDGLPNDRGYALPVQCFVCNPETHWAGIATCDLYGWRDVGPSMDPRDGNITHWAEVELPQDLSVKWPRDWGKVCMFKDNKKQEWAGPSRLVGFDPRADKPWETANDGCWGEARLATPEEAGDMVALTVPEDVRG